MSIKSLRQADARGNAVIAKALEKGQPLVQGADQRAVKWVERMLTIAGFNPGKLDTLFSSATTRALEDFQRARGLPETGALDAKTFGHLKLVQTRARRSHGKDLYAQGQKSAFIKTGEARLRRLGYDTGAVDGVFDAKTKSAMQAFKADQGKSDFKTANQWLGKGAQSVLARETKALSHGVYRARVKKDHAAHRRLDALTAAAAKKTRELPVLDKAGAQKLDAEGNPVTRTVTGIMEGDKGRAVKNLQLRLRMAGFDAKRTDGAFDERTAGALKAFQAKAGLQPTGRVGPMTWKKLSASAMYAKGDASPAQRIGEKSAAVLRTEKLLSKLGMKPGKVDGLFDAATAAATKRLERTQGQKVDGIIGANQLTSMKRATKGVTLRQLRAVMPLLSQEKAAAYLPLLNRAMAEAQINTKQRKAMFLAQLAHESVQLRYFEEIASGAAYEGRTDLGNTQPGDGVRFKGRGPIQITGRSNYRAAGQALGLPLESKPKLASRPAVGFRIAAWYWKSRGLNAYADRGDFRGVTLRINGGYNGYEDRVMYWNRAKKAL